MPIRTIIYEDNDLLRESICSMMVLDHDLELVAAFYNVNQVEQQVRVLKPDLILMDIEMPGRSGIEATRIVRQHFPKVAILILTVFDDSENVLNAIKAGASGYLLKKHISERLFSAIAEVMEGGAPMSPGVARMVIQSMQRNNIQNPYQLTPREHDILSHLSQGNSYKMIATATNISIDTVRTHIKKIYDKLQVHSMTEAVSKALNEGIV